jgi:Phage DNA Adenine Methylase-like domain 1/Phage GNAT-like domain
MPSPNILFKGITRRSTRGYTAELLRQLQPKRVIIPCVGSFSQAVAAAAAGVPTTGIICGDIGLYSTAIGRAITGEDWRLVARASHPLAEWVAPLLTDPIGKAVGVLFGLKYLSWNRKDQPIHLRDLQRELLTYADAYQAQIRAQLDELATTLRGITYQARDMWETIAEHQDDEAAVLLIVPPYYKGGYDRMFRGAGDLFDWDAPSVRQFDEVEYKRLLELLATSPALALIGFGTDGDDPAVAWGPPWRSIFAEAPSSARSSRKIQWTVANRTPPGVAMVRPKIVAGAARYPLFDGEVRPNASLSVARLDRPSGAYYRDLLMHRIAGRPPEQYLGLLLDGRLLAVVGVHLRDARIGGGIGRDASKYLGRVNLLFAFTVPHTRYARLHKLTLLCVVSRWFWRMVLHNAASGLPIADDLRAVYTTMLTDHPENKTARGILKLERREPQSDGTYKLTYAADLVDRTAEETLALWLAKHAQTQPPPSTTTP